MSALVIAGVAELVKRYVPLAALLAGCVVMFLAYSLYVLILDRLGIQL